MQSHGFLSHASHHLSVFRFALSFFVGATTLQHSAVAQSLTIRKSGTNYTVEATAPAGNPHTLQASANLNLWVDIRGGIVGQNSVPLNSAGNGKRYFRLVAASPEPEPIRVMFLGDSMGADCCGWGGGMYGYFKPSATVINYAVPWTSTKVFLQSEEVDKMMLIKPNYVLMQYHYVDGGSDPDRYTTLQEFEANLRTIVQMVRSFDGVPIMMTLHARRIFDAQRKVIPYPQDRNDVTRRLAKELGVPLIDLYYATLELFNELGPEACAFMALPGFPDDDMHFSNLGAQYIAPMILKELPPSIGPYLTNVFNPPPRP